MRACCAHRIRIARAGGAVGVDRGRGPGGPWSSLAAWAHPARGCSWPISTTQARAGRRARGAQVRDPNVALHADVDIVAPWRSAASSARATSSCCAAGSSAARPTTSSPTRASPRTSSGAGSCTRLVANAGGLINVAAEREGDRELATQRVRGIEQLMEELFEEAEATETTPLAAAYRQARRRLGRQAAPVLVAA